VKESHSLCKGMCIGTMRERKGGGVTEPGLRMIENGIHRGEQKGENGGGIRWEAKRDETLLLDHSNLYRIKGEQ